MTLHNGQQRYTEPLDPEATHFYYVTHTLFDNYGVVSVQIDNIIELKP